MFKFLSTLFKPSVPPYIGASDNRTLLEKEKSWQVREVFAMGAPTFRTVNKGEWKKYQVRNQDGSGSCVANSQSKFVEIMHQIKTGESVKFSHAPVYQARINKPQAGMGYPNAPQLQIKINTCREDICPSENKTDAQLDAIILPPNYEAINDIAKPTEFLEFTPRTFNDVAYYVEQNGAAIIWIVSDYANWNKEIPTVGGKPNGEVRHSICVVDAITYNGTRYLVIEDSWGAGFGINGSRLITQEFFNDAVFIAYALTTFKYDNGSMQYTPFNTKMQFGENSPEVRRLQDYLRTKGLFPVNVASTGYYGNITAQAVLAFQIKYSVDTIPTLNLLKGRFVGAKTLTKINQNL